LLKDFNLLATTSRGNEEDLCSEIWYLLREMGDETIQVEKTGITGLITVKSALNPFDVIKNLRDILENRPEELRYTLRVIPIESVVHTDLGEIQREAAKQASKIKENQTFRVTVEKRFTNLSSQEIVEAVALMIDRQVDLKSPDKIILVEVVGRFTGISVTAPGDIMSVTKERLGQR